MLGTPRDVYEAAKEAYLRYYDTAFWLRDPGLRSERKDLLSAAGVVFTDPLLEPVLPYDATVQIGEVCEGAGLGPEIADQLGSMLFGGDRTFGLRDHQAESLAVSAVPIGARRRNVAVTASTGSGKTESFLLPIFARLLREAQGWPAPTTVHRWWSKDRQAEPWRPVRTAEERPAGVRAMILYPTNALVEDQMSRLRRAISRAIAPGGGPRFFFGRYTGATLGSGERPKRCGEPRVRSVAQELRRMEADKDGIIRRDEDLLCQFPDPRTGELLTRWDMISTPPDILVTNYSMLNVMLMRDLEDELFDRTARWLAEDEARAFTLVVDELHTYRGTQGSEVALVVRNLLRRLGLAPGSQQLRCIATSASLTEEGGLDYLEGFFGVDRDTFVFLPGTPRPLELVEPLPRAEFVRVSGLDGAGRAAGVRELLERHPVAMALAGACDDGGGIRPTALSVIDRRVFGDRVEDGGAAFDVLLETIGEQPEGGASIPFRAHMFARIIRGTWACSDPDCPAVDEEQRGEGRRVGKLYPHPINTCLCGARVLELLYCFQCGDVSLGGSVARLEMRPSEQEEDFWYLSPGPTTVPAPENDYAYRRPYGDYMWYWPGRTPQVDRWTHKAPGMPNATSFRFLPARLDPRTGLLEGAATGGATGTMLSVANPPQEGRMRIPALPERCPRCLTKTFNGDPRIFFRGVVRSPIRGLAAGATRVTQVILDRVVETVGESAEDRKTILFTDSRDDAARAAAGVELNHFRNMIRQLVRGELEGSEPPGALLKAAA
ncbi:MAG: DEAD/DEAH box helicase, partial [Actinomycetota bacterium]|nr:DEAD/DEAH box helicase [Actinomycetota bacterium]